MVWDGTPTTSALTLSLVPSRTQTGRLLEWAFTAPVGSLNKTARLQVLAATRESFLSRDFPPPLQITSIGVGVVAFRLQEHHRDFADVLHTGERFHARGLFRIYRTRTSGSHILSCIATQLMFHRTTGLKIRAKDDASQAFFCRHVLVPAPCTAIDGPILYIYASV